MPEPVIERAPTGRSICRASGNNNFIPEGAWRIHFTVVPGFNSGNGFITDATKNAGAKAFLQSLAICKRESRSDAKICTISERPIKVGEFYVAFPNGFAEQAIHLSRAGPFVKKIMGTCELDFDVAELAKKSSLSRKDQQKAIHAFHGRQLPKEGPGVFQESSKGPKPPTGRKGFSAVPTATRKLQKPTALKKKIQKAKRGSKRIQKKSSARNTNHDSIEAEPCTGLEQLLSDLPENLHGRVMKWGRDNGMKSVDLGMEADAQKEMLTGFLSGSARVLQKRLRRRG